MATHTITQDAGGWLVEWYRDNDGDSGYGDGAQVCRWYAGLGGTYQDCVERARFAPHDKKAPLGPATDWVGCGENGGPPPYDAATATGMYDHW